MVDVSEVERRAEIVKTNVIGISPPAGSVLSTSVNDFIEMAKLYARAGVMVPPHCRALQASGRLGHPRSCGDE